MGYVTLILTMQHREMFVCDEVQYNFSLNDNILDTNFWKAKDLKSEFPWKKKTWKTTPKLNRKITKKLLEKNSTFFCNDLICYLLF